MARAGVCVATLVEGAAATVCAEDGAGVATYAAATIVTQTTSFVKRVCFALNNLRIVVTLSSRIKRVYGSWGRIRPLMDRPASAEYRVLRETIAARGSLRPILTLAGVVSWAAVFTAVLVFLPYPVAAAVPLVILAATFEAIRPLHFGAERMGRYLQVFYEEQGQEDRVLSDTPAWERVAMRLGPSVPGAGGHPLFVPVFFLATVVNFLAVLLPGPVAIELGMMAVPHLSFIAWLLAADRAMRRQRGAELARFRQLRDAIESGLDDPIKPI